LTKLQPAIQQLTFSAHSVLSWFHWLEWPAAVPWVNW